jgi:hypothetical protein
VALEQSPNPAVETWTGREGRGRYSETRRHPPVGDHHQTPGETETISGAGDSPFVRQMLGDLFEPASEVEGRSTEDQQR